MDLLCHVLQLLDQYLVLCLGFFYVFVYFVGTVHSVSAQFVFVFELTVRVVGRHGHHNTRQAETRTARKE